MRARIAYSYDLPFIVLCEKKEIMYQWIERLEKWLRTDVKQYGDGVKETGDVMVAMYQSLRQDKDVIKKLRHPVMICDEVHHVSAESYRRITYSLPAIHRIGLSATAWREDGAWLAVEGGAGAIVANISAAELIDRGYLATPEWRLVRVPSMRLPRSWEKAYVEGVVANEERNKLIIREAEKAPKPCLIDVKRINHGKLLAERLDAVFIHGETPAEQRKRVFRQIERGEIDIIVSTLLNEGVSIPHLKSCIYAGAYKSRIAAIQCVGRVLHSKHKRVLIVDFLDSSYPFLAKWAETRIRGYKDYYGEKFKYSVV